MWKILIPLLVLPIGLVFRLIPIGDNMVNKNLSGVSPAIPFSESGKYTDVKLNESLINSSISFVENSILSELEASELITMSAILLWIVGVIFMVLFYFIYRVKFKSAIMKSSHLLQNEFIYGVQNEIFILNKKRMRISSRLSKSKKLLPVYLNENISSPLIFGIFRPAIILPHLNYDDVALKIIIEHELTHYIRKDLLLKSMASIIKIIHWYNPIVRKMINAMNQDIEICCDRDICAHREQTFKNKYSDILLDAMIQNVCKKDLLSACMGSEGDEMKRRFKSIYSCNFKRGGMTLTLGLMIVLVMGTIIFADETISIEPPVGREHQQAVAQAISDNDAKLKQQSENIDEPAFSIDLTTYRQKHTNTNGDFDEEAFWEEVWPLIPVGDFDQKSKEISYSLSKDGSVGPHVLNHGEIGAYYKNSEELWNLKKGDKVTMRLDANADYYANNSGVTCGYVKDDEYIHIVDLKSPKRLQGTEKIVYEIPEDGEYYFFLLCFGDGVIVEWLSIEV